MNHLQIKYTLESKGVSMREIAKRIGVSVTAVSNVCMKKMVSDRIMAGVADALGIPKEIAFPEYYMAPKKKPGRRPRREYPQREQCVNV